jgi:hypothetical protein
MATDFRDFIPRLHAVPPGTIIPKPAAGEGFVVKGWGTRRGETALVYFIPNHKHPDRPHQKGVNLTELKLAFDRLVAEGEFNREWFDNALADCASEGGCNFTTIAGLMCLLDVARFAERGVYRLK